MFWAEQPLCFHASASGITWTCALSSHLDAAAHSNVCVCVCVCRIEMKLVTLVQGSDADMNIRAGFCFMALLLQPCHAAIYSRTEHALGLQLCNFTV